VVSIPRLVVGEAGDVPVTKNSTWSTVPLSVAVAATVTGKLTSGPGGGEVIVTVGGGSVRHGFSVVVVVLVVDVLVLVVDVLVVDVLVVDVLVVDVLDVDVLVVDVLVVDVLVVVVLGVVVVVVVGVGKAALTWNVQHFL
jgi:hypothetical protein